MASKKIRVGIVGANVRYGWGSSAHIPALRGLDEFEITAVSTSRQETSDHTA
jgi:predicted dehydrogenase